MLKGILSDRQCVVDDLKPQISAFVTDRAACLMPVCINKGLLRIQFYRGEVYDEFKSPAENHDHSDQITIPGNI